VTSSSRGRPGTRETSPERTKVWTEPKPKTPRKVSVVYYLSRNGHLEHPHFMEVPLSSPHGLYLKGTVAPTLLIKCVSDSSLLAVSMCQYRVRCPY